MKVRAEDWRTQWQDAWNGAKNALALFEKRCADGELKNEVDAAAADAEIAIVISQLCLLRGLPIIGDGSDTLARARHVLRIAQLTFDELERIYKQRN